MKALPLEQYNKNLKEVIHGKVLTTPGSST